MNTLCTTICRTARRLAFIPMLCTLLLQTVTSQANANLYSGGDWAGGNLILHDGDSLSGTFSNVGLFEIYNGALIRSVSEQLGIYAKDIYISGLLDFGDFANPQVTLSAQRSIVLAPFAVLNAGNDAVTRVVLPATSGGITLSAGPPLPGGGDLTVTPIPSAIPLLGSGLAFLGFLRRKKEWADS